MNWKYKIELTSIKVFAEIEKERNIIFPEELKNFIVKTNAATPSKYNFKADGIEKVFGAVLCFNRNEPDVDTVFTALETIYNTDLIPFAIDPFGNYICYSLKNKGVVFWDHEIDKTIAVSDSLSTFINSLF